MTSREAVSRTMLFEVTKSNLNFSSTFTTIDEKEKEVSNIQRYRLISEFRSHSMIPPPLCVVTYPYLIIKHVANQCKSTAKCRCATDGNNSEDSVSTLGSTSINKCIYIIHLQNKILIMTSLQNYCILDIVHNHN